MLVRQLEEELRMRMRGPNMELQQQVELLLNENDHLTREVAILRETIKVNTFCADGDYDGFPFNDISVHRN